MQPTPESGVQPSRREWWQRRPPTGIAGAVFWLALWFTLLALVRKLPFLGNPLWGWMQLLVGIVLIGLAIPLAWRLITHRMLWSVRNKLVLTYLLIGLAPFILFLTLVIISAYIAAGQFSIHLADTRMRQQLDEIGMENAARASRLSHILHDQANHPATPQPQGPFGSPMHGHGEGPRRPHDGQNPPNSEAQIQQPATETSTQAAAPIALGEIVPDTRLTRLHRHYATYLDGAPLSGVPEPPAQAASAVPAAVTSSSPAESTTGPEGIPLGLPPWAVDLHGNQFRGLVLDGEDLFLVAIDQRHIEAHHILTVITSLPVNSALMDVVAEGLGRVRLSGLMTGNSRTPPVTSEPATKTGRTSVHRIVGTDLQRTSVFGGSEPSPVNFCDFGVPFVSTMYITDWDSGQPDNVPVEVHSRPSKLYQQLFGSSLGGIVTNYIRYGLIGLCILFALIESIALRMALRLSGNITTSVEELYAATQRVDRGDFVQRIPETNTSQQDQLGELSHSFNRMTGSLERLMHEQQEKERLQSELSIAQEVQANLFPRSIRDLPSLQLHGICRPARSVSGDYYDFLVFHDGKPANGKPCETGVGIALGDISGKGISAALLMATLHSAVRAYRLTGEDLAHSNGTGVLPTNPEGINSDSGKLFESPARILALLNRHLYRTTAPEKYATLFLAHYDAATARMTYSNAGHLPPLVLGRGGKVRRLDQGGTVVGLMDGMHYDEDSFQMLPGDILVAYSDGITEPENDFGEFGEERLMEVVARYRDQPLHVISAQVMLALDAWIGAEEQPDDITLVLARQV